MTNDFRLPPGLLPKATLWLRALRRRTLDYWYASMEGPEAAHVEAALAAIVVNVLDETVFEAAFEAAYREHRGSHPLGRVVMGLELIRNCEIHSSEAGELKEHAIFGVPDAGFRQILHWPALQELPEEYRRRQDGEQRARGEARDAYRRWVADRPVIETLLDADGYFTGLDDAIAPAEGPRLAYAFAVLPLGADDEPVVCRPMGLDRYATFLPDLACRSEERRAAHWPSADQWLDEQNKRIRKAPPATSHRQVTKQARDASGKVVAYAGLTGAPGDPYRSGWVERAPQVGRDIRMGCQYYIISDGDTVDLASDEQLRVTAVVDGADRLTDLSDSDSEQDLDYLHLLEENPDLYRRSRTIA